jgi:hypothetical protein
LIFVPFVIVVAFVVIDVAERPARAGERLVGVEHTP